MKLISNKIVLLAMAGILFAGKMQAQEDSNMIKSLRVYGFAMVDMGYNFNQIDPRWFEG